FFFFQAEDGIRDLTVTGVQTCALPISRRRLPPGAQRLRRCPRPAGPGRAAETGTLMRIIAGEFRGRTLRPPSDRRVRPTADRVRSEERRVGKEGGSGGGRGMANKKVGG